VCSRGGQIPWIGAARRLHSEKAVVVFSVENIHQLEVDVVFRLFNTFGLSGVSIVGVDILIGIAPVTVCPPTIFYDTPAAKCNAAYRADSRSVGTRMIFTLQGFHPLLKHDSAPTTAYSETQLIPKPTHVKWNIEGVSAAFQECGVRATPEETTGFLLLPTVNLRGNLRDIKGV
jgi:hypothetical protein